MNKRKIIKATLLLAVTGIVVGGSVVLYMFNMPHRDVQSAKADFTLTGTQIVSEYLTDAYAANQKYLSDDGESKILEIKGTVSKISDNFDGQKVVLLKSNHDRAGVSATFTPKTNQKAAVLKIGQQVTIKGVIRSGASYDEDLELYENVIIEKADVVSK